MSPEMITAIGAFVLGIASIVSAILLNRKTVALLEYRMLQVEKRLDEHNHYAEKFAETSDKISAIKEDLAAIKATLDFIKEK